MTKITLSIRYAWQFVNLFGFKKFMQNLYLKHHRISTKALNVMNEGEEYANAFDYNFILVGDYLNLFD